MYHIFIYEKKRLLHDFDSGEITEISRIEKEILPHLEELAPLPEECPTTLRYSLAKYESTEVEAAYRRLYSLAQSKKISPRIGAPRSIKIRTEDKDLAKKALGKALNDFPTVEEVRILSRSKQNAEEFKEYVKENFSFICVTV